MMRARNAAARAGMSLVELAGSVVLLATVLGVPAMLLKSGSDAYAVETASTGTTELAKEGLERIADRLEVAMAASLGPPATADFVVYTRGLGYQAGTSSALPGPVERIQFEASPGDPDDGIDNDGDGIVDEGRAVWIENPGQANERRVTLLDSVAEVASGEILGNGADDNGNGLVDEGGLSFEYDGGRATIRVTVSRPGPGGTVVTKDLQRTVAFRN